MNNPFTGRLANQETAGSPCIVRVILDHFPLKNNQFYVCRRNQSFRLVHLVEGMTGEDNLLPSGIQNLPVSIHLLPHIKIILKNLSFSGNSRRIMIESADQGAK